MNADSNLTDRTFAALADPTRRAILARLAEGEATVGELAEPFAISQPAVSQHLRVLEQAGLIVRRIDGQRRPCRLAPDGLARLEESPSRWEVPASPDPVTHPPHLLRVFSVFRGQNLFLCPTTYG